MIQLIAVISDKVLYVELFFSRDISFEHYEGEVIEKNSANGSDEGTGSVFIFRVFPLGHVGIMDVSEVYATYEVRVAESIEECSAIRPRDEDPRLLRDYIAV